MSPSTPSAPIPTRCWPEFRPVLLAAAAARRHPRRLLGHAARLPGAAPARRLSRHRDAGLRRDHPPGADQLDRVLQRHAGISGIPRPFFGIPFTAADNGFAAVFGLEFSPLYRTIFLYYLILCLALLTAFVTPLRRLPVGRAWEAREDEIACRSLGINTTNTKLTAFSIGAMFGGFAGAFFAARQGFISPEFVFIGSAVILAIVVLGGMGSLWGCAIAAIAMIGGTELLRGSNDEADLRQRLRPDEVPHADLRLRHGGDHDLEAARPDLDPRAHRLPQGEEEDLGRHGPGGHG
jgi:hypothetical protein